jgi:glyoxylase-like metal-dependent hydrolase (beta-lactamase superfamily II)
LANQLQKNGLHTAWDFGGLFRTSSPYTPRFFCFSGVASHRFSPAVTHITGQNDALIHNAQQLNIDISIANAIMLSHGHYDHTGGVGAVLELAWGTRIYAHTAAFEPKFSQKYNGSVRYIGMSL